MIYFKPFDAITTASASTASTASTAAANDGTTTTTTMMDTEEDDSIKTLQERIEQKETEYRTQISNMAQQLRRQSWNTPATATTTATATAAATPNATSAFPGPVKKLLPLNPISRIDLVKEEEDNNPLDYTKYGPTVSSSSIASATATADAVMISSFKVHSFYMPKNSHPNKRLIKINSSSSAAESITMSLTNEKEEQEKVEQQPMMTPRRSLLLQRLLYQQEKQQQQLQLCQEF
jgi:hypothetical protein